MTRCVSRPALLVAAIVIASLPLAARHAVAAGPTFTVDSLLDQPDDGTMPGTCHTAAGTCTLRAAIMQANRTTGVGATVALPAGVYALTIPASGSDGETNGDLNLTTPASGNPFIAIVGAGAESTIIDANQLDRVFSIEHDRTAQISGVTIRNGFVAGFDTVGGGILSGGTLILSNATIESSQADSGGGIYIYVFAVSSYLEVRNSTISGNRATSFNGGGIASARASMLVVNSTISQNDANDSGGGVYSPFGNANVYNTTIVFNHADADNDGVGRGGGVYTSSSSVLNLRNTLLAGNFTSGGPGTFSFNDDCAGVLNGAGKNLFWEAPVSSCTLGGDAGSWNSLNDLNTLGPLQDNGGPTQTHALLAGSNAIDGTDGSACVDDQGVPLTTDQRGSPRVSGVGCDIGAFEVPEPGAMAAFAAAMATLASLRRVPRILRHGPRDARRTSAIPE